MTIESRVKPGAAARQNGAHLTTTELQQLRVRATPAELQERFDRHDRNLSNVDISGEDLRTGRLFRKGRSWINATLINNDLRDVDARGAVLNWTVLDGTIADRINLSGASASFTRGSSLLNVPALSMIDANAKGLVMDYSLMAGLNATGTRFDRIVATHTRFVNANFDGAIFWRGSLVDTDLTMASAFNTEMARADLRGAHGLETVKGLETISFYKTIVTPQQRDIILARRSDRRGMLVVVEDLRRRQ